MKNQKGNLHHFLYMVAGLLCLGFCVRAGMDYLSYDPVANSAPFSAFLLVRAFTFLLPAGILFVLGLLMKKKSS